MADKPSDAPGYKKEQAQQAAQDTGSAIGVGIKKTLRDSVKVIKLNTLFTLALYSAAGGLIYDTVRGVIAPEPGNDTVLEQSVRLDGQTGVGYQAFVAANGVSPIVLVRGNDGGFELYREITEDGDRELQLVANHVEAAAIMEQVSRVMTQTAEELKNGASADTSFIPYTMRYDDISPAYKDQGSIQRFVSTDGNANRTTLSEASYRAMSTLWSEAAQKTVQDYGFNQDEIKQFIEQEEHGQHFAEGWKYSMLGFMGLFLAGSISNGASAGISHARTRRRRRKNKETGHTNKR